MFLVVIANQARDHALRQGRQLDFECAANTFHHIFEFGLWRRRAELEAATWTSRYSLGRDRIVEFASHDARAQLCYSRAKMRALGPSQGANRVEPRECLEIASRVVGRQFEPLHLLNPSRMRTQVALH